LDETIGDALLCGEIQAASAPMLVPNALQERILWERAIESSLAGELVESLFDRGGMAAVAMEANRLLQAWRVALPGGEQSEETQQFLRWRGAFRKACAKSDWMESARYFEWQIDQLEGGAGQLPQQLHIAGFDRLSPQESRLFDVLAARGVEIKQWSVGLNQPAPAIQVKLADADAECRAAVAWAQKHLAQNPRARIAIVAPELGTLRAKLASLLDDVLHPEAILPASAEMPRQYDFSLGTALILQTVVATGLGLLNAVAGRRRIEQETFGALLLQPYWSAGAGEADGRAQLEASIRADLPAVTTLDRLYRFVRKQAERGIAVASLADDLEALLQVHSRLPARQPPSAWTGAFCMLLGAAGWPGERGLSSHEFQAQQAFSEVLEGLAQLDTLLGMIDMAEALRRLNQACSEQIFQVRTEGDPPLQVLGMLEAAGAPLDALWVLGMNDHAWPPPARPNPLLPATAQRAARAPNADAAVQAEFARAIHERLLHSAHQVVFSHAHAEGDRELRPSPLVAGLPAMVEIPAMVATLAESLADHPVSAMTQVDDHLAPQAREGERISGGASLLKAQAVCPAWAYYQYRLGARALETPVDGLDAAGRGSLLHAALERFWQGRSSAVLSSSDVELTSAVAEAVAEALATFNAGREEPLPPGFSALEGGRLQQLVLAWLEFEKTRAVPFEVKACEQEVRLEIEGIAMRLIIDRIDALDNSRLVIIDYKTGATVDFKNWAEDRITEPQLPIYASVALSGEKVVAVVFAKVRSDDRRFSGIAAEEALLPGVLGLGQDKSRKDFSAEQFPDWEALLAHWQSSVQAIAREVKAGEAAVRFGDEKDMEYCEVKPLLRLPERKLLFERMEQ
jgi:exodeoxyribonuclease-5